MRKNLFKPGILPGVSAVVVSVLVWQVVSLFFLEVFLPGPLVLLDRLVLVFSDPDSYLVVGQTLIRIF